MHDILRERIWRKLQALPPEQVYQVLDYLEFLEAKYARERAREPDAIQKFAERLEDGMRFRSVAPKVISGTVGLLGSARRVLRTVSDAGREILDAAAPQEPRQPNGRGVDVPAPRSISASSSPRPLTRPAAPRDPQTSLSSQARGSTAPGPGGTQPGRGSASSAPDTSSPAPDAVSPDVGSAAPEQGDAPPGPQAPDAGRPQAKPSREQGEGAS